MDICKLLGFVLSIVAVENQSTTSKSSFSVRGLSAMVRAHNTEIKIMKQQILEQKRLIESLQKQVEAGSLKPKIRLVNGKSSREGRVEVYKDGVWGTVCDNGWDFNDANVVCKQLFGLDGIPYSNAYFGPGTGLILMSNVRCSGTENSLLDCGHTDELNLGCSHSEDAGVMCMKAPRVRLSKQKDFQGRVEVYKNNRWGTICGRNWDYRDASVICRSLGYSERGLVVLNSVFGGGTGTIHLNDVQCSGKETGLFNCTYSETSCCSHSEVAGAICILPSHKTRIVNGSSPDEGRVDVLVNNRWRRVCNNGWGSSDATVACRSLGFMGGFSVSLPTIRDQKTENWFLNQMYCNGNEDSLLKCARSITTSCSSEAGVLCYKTLNSTVRLVNGSSPDEGRVEVLVNSRWRPVCSSSWDKNDARVACRSLGYLGGFSVSLPTIGDQKTENWFLNQMYCNGNEDSLLKCARSITTSCSSEAGVLCYKTLNSTVRLVNGSSPDEGRVEVLVNSRWRPVCSSSWDKNDARVACRSLGYLGGFSVSLPRTFSRRKENWFLNQLYCNGREDSLLKCANSVSTGCSSEAGVLCYQSLNSTVRLVNGSFPNVGRVEVLVNSRWRPVCFSSWDKNDTRVACRSLGYLRGFSFSSPTTVSRGKDKWFLYIIGCSGIEDSLLRCANSVSTSCSYETRVMCYQPLNSEDTTTSPVPVEEKCRLAPNVDVGAVTPGEVEGIKFGDTFTSRYEYTNWKSMRVQFTMSIEFKTTSSGGVIMYAVGWRKIDFFALTLKEGRLVFSFDCGSGALNLETDQTYNDGKWHTVDFGRVDKWGKISVDGETPKEGISPGGTKALNVRRPYFLGGITPQLQGHDKIKGHLQGVLGSFDGCIRNMKINENSFGEPVREQKVSQCVANLEQGTFFNDQGGYITLFDDYEVGLDFAFNLDIRPKNLSGVILAVHGSSKSDDFILLQLVDGKVIATADNGLGEVTTTYVPRSENALCDGEWHKISDFNRRSILVDRNFSGCMRNFEIRRGKDDSYQPKYFAGAKAITGNITLNKCPLN